VQYLFDGLLRLFVAVSSDSNVRKDLNQSFEQQSASGGAGQGSAQANGDYKTHLSPKSQGRTLKEKDKSKTSPLSSLRRNSSVVSGPDDDDDLFGGDDDLLP
jgi:hypothetical protein